MFATCVLDEAAKSALDDIFDAVAFECFLLTMMVVVVDQGISIDMMNRRRPLREDHQCGCVASSGINSGEKTPYGNPTVSRCAFKLLCGKLFFPHREKRASEHQDPHASQRKAKRLR